MPRNQPSEKQRSSKRGSILLTLILLIPTAVIDESALAWAQDAEMVLQFNSQGIPVESIQVNDRTIAARLVYKAGDRFTPERIEKEIVLLLSGISERFPDADQIVLDSYIEDKHISTIACPVPKALDLAKGRTTLTELLSGMRITRFLNIEEELAAVLSVRMLALEEDSRGSQLPEKVRKGSERRSASRDVSRTASLKTLGSGPTGIAGAMAAATRDPQWIFITLIIGGAFCLLLLGAIIVLWNKGREPKPKIFARLDIYGPDDDKKQFVIQGRQTAIGRAPGNTLVINDPNVSSRHAAIVISGRDFILEDLGSTNGTFLNGRKTNREALYIGDEIAVGATRMILTD